MTTSSRIARVFARQVLDSRGRPTVEVDVELSGGATGRACAPSGASTGRHAAGELRAGAACRWEGRGVSRAVGHVRSEIAGALTGLDAGSQGEVDRRMVELDGTPNLARLGANAVLATSLAVCAMIHAQVLGDDLFATNRTRIATVIERGVANAVLIKVNQNGTLTGTLEAIAAARAGGYATVVSARSGETEDPFIADLAVGTGAGQIKIGSVRSSERLAKYNQLLRIEEDPGLEFAGTSGIAGQTNQAAA